MAFDHKTFGSKIGMSADDLAALDGLFSKYPTAGATIESELAAQVDARLTPLKAEIDSKQRDLDAQFETLASIRTGDADQVAAAEKRIETMSAEMATLRERAKSVARQAGLNPDDVLKDLTPTTTTVVTPKASDFDPTKVSAAINMGALNALEQAALIEDLRAEHRDLFPNKPFNGLELIQTLKETVKRTGNTALGLRDVYEQKYNVAARRAELNESEVQRRIDDAVAKAKTEVNDQNALRASNLEVPAFTGSPLLAAFNNKDKAPIQHRGIPEAVSASIVDFQKRVRERKAS